MDLVLVLSSSETITEDIQDVPSDWWRTRLHDNKVLQDRDPVSQHRVLDVDLGSEMHLMPEASDAAAAPPCVQSLHCSV